MARTMEQQAAQETACIGRLTHARRAKLRASATAPSSKPERAGSHLKNTSVLYDYRHGAATKNHHAIIRKIFRIDSIRYADDRKNDRIAGRRPATFPQHHPP
ncbi:hypothetical protein P0D88_09260 [Paraburkholderia sp. RL18-103-BIB-C]|uniref:hypothetical protein n=2 Tax=unclassified Paraburkholderia TaxID=2615204 RepID=UPI0038BD0CE5